MIYCTDGKIEGILARERSISVGEQAITMISRLLRMRFAREYRSPSVLLPVAIGLTLALGFSPVALAHAVLMKSNPQANGSVPGPDVPVSLTFNSRVDQSRSTIVLEKPDHSTFQVRILSDPSSPQTLVGRLSSIKPGPYKLHWQVLAVDGHITRGVINFEVT